MTKMDAPSITLDMLLPLLVMAVGFTLYYVTVVLMRTRCEILESEATSTWAGELVDERGH